MDNNSQDPYGPQMIQRCVIVQKDEKGYGLTVSGDNPVFIQSVKNDGAASRAGVQKGDRIIKVNGTLVTSCNHVEVVKLIRSASYAALTLLGFPPGVKNQMPLHQGSSTTTNSNQKKVVTKPLPVTPEKDAQLKNERMMTFKNMLEREQEQYEKTKAEYAINPSEKLLKELKGFQTRIQVVEQQLNKAASMVPMAPMTDASRDRSSSSAAASPPDHEVNNKHTREDRTSRNTTKQDLPQGIVHPRQRSSPDSLGVVSEVPPGTNLKRNNSDAQSKDTSRKKHVRAQGGADAEIRRKRNANAETFARSQSLPSEPGVDDVAEDSSPNSTPPSNRRTNEDTECMDASSVVTSKPHRDGTVVPPSGQSLKMAAMNVDDPFSPPATATDSSSGTSGPQVQIISMEDDDFQSDNETFEDHGPFIKLEQLEKKPAHMSIFMHYLISNSDPSSLFFYLVTDNYKSGSLKEMKKWVYEIFSTFLAHSAPLRIQVNEATVQSIETTMHNSLNNEEAMRNVFLTARQNATVEVRELLADFRAKRALGLGSIFGDQQLHNEGMDRTQELKIIEQTLMPHLDRLTTLEAEREDKNVAMAFAITTFMKQVGVRVTSNSPLERCPSFTARDKRPKWAKNKKQHIKGHQFVEMHYQTTVFCNHCSGLLWGIGFQGYQCQNCEFNIHKTGLCLDQLEDQCSGKEGKKKRGDWRRMIPGGQRRTSDRMSQFLPSSVFFTGDNKKEESDKQATSPSAVGPQPLAQVRVGLKEDEEIAHLKDRMIVDNLVKSFEEKKDDPLVGSRSSLQADSGISESYDRLPDVTEGDSAPTAKQKSFLARSASLKTKGEERKERRVPGDRRSRRSNDRSPSQSIDDVDVDGRSVVTALINTSHASSSSSLSTSQDSPSASNDSLSSRVIEEDQAEDSDMEAEADPPNWQDLVDKDIVKRLKPKEVKRQEVINELFHTEKSHVRNLKVLDRVFYRVMLQEQVLNRELIHAVFPNLNEMLQLHGPLNNFMKKERRTSHVIQEVGQSLLKTFDGEAGETAKRVCATFCQNQKAALEMLKIRQKKDSKLAQFLADAEANHLCRRLPLQAIITTGMQRLTKYPLLIENLMKYTQPKLKEYSALERSLQCAKKLLAHVNQAVKECENHQRLLDINRHLDKGPFERSNHSIAVEYKNLDLTSRKLLHDGQVTWKLSKTKTIELYALLFADILVLLQKQDEKYIMKCHSTTVPTQVEEKKNTHSPIIKINSVLCREVATNKRAFFLVSTSSAGPQIYELTTISMSERQTWMDMILNAQEEAKKASKSGWPPACVSSVSNLKRFPDLHEEEVEETSAPTDTASSPSTGMEAVSTSVEINNPPQISQPEVVMQSTVVTDDTRPCSQDTLALLEQKLQEDISPEARANVKAQGIVDLSNPLTVLLQSNGDKPAAPGTHQSELMYQAVKKINQLGKHLQSDVARLETELQQATQDRRSAQQALLEQSQIQMEELRRLSRQEGSNVQTFDVRISDTDRLVEPDELLTARTKANRISSSAESGDSTTDSEEYGTVESSEPDDASSYTPKERPSSLIMEEGVDLDQAATIIAGVRPSVSNDGLVNLQRAQVCKVTDVDSVEIDRIMADIVTITDVNVSTQIEAVGERKSAVREFTATTAATEETWDDVPQELDVVAPLSNLTIEGSIATRLDDLLNEESDSETVIPAPCERTCVDRTSSESNEELTELIRNDQTTTDVIVRDRELDDGVFSQTELGLERDKPTEDTMRINLGEDPPLSVDMPLVEEGVALIAPDLTATLTSLDEMPEVGNIGPEGQQVNAGSAIARQSGILAQAKNITFTHPPHLV